MTSYYCFRLKGVMVTDKPYYMYENKNGSINVVNQFRNIDTIVEFMYENSDKFKDIKFYNDNLLDEEFSKLEKNLYEIKGEYNNTRCPNGTK